MNATISGAKLVGRILAFGFGLAVMTALLVLLPPRPAHAATFTVNSTGDAGDASPDGVCDSNSTVKVTCTLREAIQESNASTATDDTIAFAIPDNLSIPGLEVKTISPASALPNITDTVTIDGYTQGGAAVNTATTNANNAVLKIELNGANAGTSASGLAASGAGAGGTTIRGLAINRFGDDGVFVSAPNTTIEGNFIGTNAAGDEDFGNGGNGVTLLSSGYLIGDKANAAQNIISGNEEDGVHVPSSAASGVISNNHIGTDADAGEDLGNSGSGVALLGASGVIIGGTGANGAGQDDGASEDGEGNIISGNDRQGVAISGTSSSGARPANRVLGNYIGLDRNGSGFSDIGNTLDGVRVGLLAVVEVGGTVTGQGNTISANGEDGVEISSTSSGGVRVLGNRIGTNFNGSSDFGNALNGVRIQAASNIVVGGTSAGARNIISGNDLDGISISGSDSTNNRIEGNRIGTDMNGTSDLGNLQGVNITTEASGNFVGGPEIGAANLISGNTVRGVIIAGDATDNKVQSNFIGTNVFGTADLGSGDSGMEIFDGSNNVIGGTASRTGNVISGNDTDGVEINLGSNGNKVEGNLIGAGVNGALDLGNSEVGVLVRGSGNFVGGTASGARNVISGNGGVGVSMLGIGASGNTVQGNLIGTQVDGTTPLSNFHGVFVSDASNNTVGGTVPEAANTISGNANHGVQIIGAAATGNRVLRNSIFENGLLGIELNNDGITLNDNKDPDTGPNRLQNFPVITSATTSGDTTTTIQARLNSTPNKTFLVQFFSNPTPNFPTGFGEGKEFLGQKSVTTDSDGGVTFTKNVPAVPAGENVTATATGPGGNTSELSRSVVVE